MKKTLVRLTALLFVFALVFTASGTAMAQDAQNLDELKAQFVAGEGPVVGKYSVDYRYFSPVKENDTKKYPLVIWLHGMGEGKQEGQQIQKNNIACWTSEEFQSRFDPAGGAFILAARSREEENVCWTNEMVEPLKAAIDEFIAENKDNIDLSRIYIGGFSMGGKMTFKMAVAYPEMFAAIYPICPAWSPNLEQLEELADTPVWITSSTKDPLVNYYMGVTKTWEKLCSVSNVAEECRLATLTTVCYADGTQCPSSHHAWFSVNNDMFSAENGAYPNMTIVNGVGETVVLEYPDGMISWLCSHTSDYDGTPSQGMGNLEGVIVTDNPAAMDIGLFGLIKGIINTLISMIFG